MSNIVTAVKVALDSDDVDSAVGSAKSLSNELGPKLTSNIGKVTAGFTAVSAAAYAIYSALDTVNAKVRDAADSADDFTSAMDDTSRTRLLQVAADVGVVDDELARLQARQAAAMADTSDWFDEMVVKAAQIQTTLIESVFGTPRSVEEIQFSIDQLNQKMEEADKNSLEYFSLLGQRNREVENLSKAQQAILEFEVSQTKYLSDLEASRAAQLRRFNRDQIDALREEMEAQIAVYDAQIAQDPTPEVIKNLEYQKETARLVGEARIQQAEELLAAERKRIDETERREQEAESNRIQRLAERRANEWSRIQDEIIRDAAEAAAEAQRISDQAIRETGEAAHSVLNYINEDLANLYSAIDDVIRLLQTLEMIQGAGGIFGMFGGVGGFSSGGVSSFGGVSVGSVSVTVQGNTDTVGMKNAAQEGVYGALNGIVKDTLAKESNYGGLLNPSSGVHRM